jgi:NAD(P)H dehydrogenase (quinone)
MKIIVTGASGQYGRMTVDGLLQKIAPAELILMTRQPAKLVEYAQRGVTVRFGDFDDPASLLIALAGADRMLLISASRVGQRIPQHGNAIRAAAKAGVRHIVYTSFAGNTPGNPSIAVAEHRATEEMLQKSGCAWTALRDSQYAEAMVEAAAPIAIKNARWVACAADGKIALVTRPDCVAAAVAVLTSNGHENQVYNITGPELLSYRQVAALMSELSGKPIEYQIVSDEQMYAHWDRLGIPREALTDGVVNGVPWSSNDMVSFEAAIRGGYSAILSDDVERLTGRKPKSLRALAMESIAMLKSC